MVRERFLSCLFTILGSWDATASTVLKVQHVPKKAATILMTSKTVLWRIEIPLTISKLGKKLQRRAKLTIKVSSKLYISCLFTISISFATKVSELLLILVDFSDGSNNILANIKRTRTSFFEHRANSIGDRTRTPYFWLRTNEHQTLILIGLSLDLLNYSSNWLEHHFLNIERTRTTFFEHRTNSIGDRTGTPYFWLRTNKHRTLNLIGLSLDLLNYSSNGLKHHFFEHWTNSKNIFWTLNKFDWWLNSNTLFLALNEQTSNIEPNRAFTTFTELLIELTRT